MRQLAQTLVAVAVGALMLGACAHGGVRDLAAGAPQDAVRHFPEAIPNTYLGMPFADWQAAHPELAPDQDGFDFRIVVTQKAPAPGLAEVTWYFDTDQPGQPLYEGIFDYGQDEARHRERVAALGPPNTAEGEWLYETSMGYPVKVWSFATKIVTAARIAGTEWDGEW
jgi:hypothetical protein